MNPSSLVVVSPPGGVGEVAAVKAALLGNSVKWFIVSSEAAEEESPTVSLSQSILNKMEAAGGKVELAGAEARSLLLAKEEEESAVGAVGQWCGTCDAIVCTLDGVEAAANKEDVQEVLLWKNAIKIAAEQASNLVQRKGVKLAILGADDEGETDVSGGGLLSSVFGNKKQPVPESLCIAMGSRGLTKLRHGELFGTPESSPAFAAFLGGPLKQPRICEEYTMRGIRIDPTRTISGTLMMGKEARSSRLSVGEAAAQIVSGNVLLESQEIDLSLSSLRGYEKLTDESWKQEFEQLAESMSAEREGGLFSAKFSSVPDVNRFADWLATKWVPAVLRTYDVAAIRFGARPVSASRTADGRVEILWQELVDFNPVTSARLIVQVSDTELVANRGPGDASKGFGGVRQTPLPGEGAFIQSLADAASQAVEKGLAMKAKKEKPKKKVKEEVPQAVSTIQSVVTVEEPATTTTVEAPTSDTGPRQAGARRSSERSRGNRRRKEDSTSSKENDTEENTFQ